MLNSPFITTEDLNSFTDLINEMDTLKDNEYARAYNLHKKALGIYDRWSSILYEVRSNEGKGIPKNPPLKDRVGQILKMIDNVYVSSRMVWNKSKDDISEGRY
ncbi:hypothetical protein FDE76_13305 [Clostridium botulinum]|uniref:Uncharacterized protein n=1 Tax=Clostridium botulinum (strain Eklund 17B / Type B) TaxID=935198 RepID=B2TNY8_CLOBB|nr:hypothetical protein CLL_A2757 [Clostridium botulinum B str. Eklund 17B (NRP)]MBY6976257.1 hypothetical protein [Clostridium botulinum]MBY7000682.1 hypothetical protein [Clostridium botulinum]MCR1273446.1 hypothetical protein [Clostridium botulinum]NFD71297.1 hypothetical protein [Clostridium botulinum]